MKEDDQNENNITFPFTDLEPYFSDASLGAKEIKRLDSRVSVHVHSLRHRLADPDGISAKAVIDGIVKAGILTDDTSKQIKEVSFSQKKISKKQAEITVIEIKSERRAVI